MVGLSHAHAAGTPPWTNVQTLSTTTTRSYDPVAIAVTPDGSKQIVLWESTDSGVRSIKSASATLSGGVALWGPTATVATLTDDSSRPDVALSWDGTRATAVWQDVSGINQLIRSGSATISGTSQTWGSAFNVYTAPNSIAGVPKVALSAGGDLAVVTWYATITDQFQILARAAGNYGTAPQTDGLGGCSFPVRARRIDAEGVFGSRCRSTTRTREDADASESDRLR